MIPHDNNSPHNSSPHYFQLYFHDTHNEVYNGMKTQHNENLSGEVVKKLMKILEKKFICTSSLEIEIYNFLREF